MRKEFITRLVINDQELGKVFEDLQNAEETIRECCRKLEDMGVLVVERASGCSEDQPG